MRTMVLITRIGKASGRGCHVHPRVRSFGKLHECGGWEAGDANMGIVEEKVCATILR
jgi:hypothetical protein